jgi:hypothetical protein
MGSLEPFHYSYAYYLDCGYYNVAFREQTRCASDNNYSELTLGFRTMDFGNPIVMSPVGEVLPAAVTLVPGREASPITAEGEFHVQAFEQTDTISQAHFAGRFVISKPGWSIDVNVDVQTQFSVSCTLF